MDASAVLEECRLRSEQGRSPAEIIDFLHGRGLTITESIKAVKQIFGISLGEAKEIVSSHPCWSGVVEAAGPLHDRLAKKGQSRKRPALMPRRSR